MNIYISNLSFKLDEDSLREHFEQYGAVEKVSIVYDRDTERSRGFGFVEMPNPSEAAQAIAQTDGSEIGGRVVVCNEAHERRAGGDKNRRRG